MELFVTNSALPEECVVTLYDIVNVINQEELEKGDVDSKGQPKTRHLNSMKKIEKLAEEPLFGSPLKISVVYNDKGQTVETYAFTKIQAIAAAARVNNKYLMMVVKELKRLQNQISEVPEFSNRIAAAEAWLEAEKKRMLLMSL